MLEGKLDLNKIITYVLILLLGGSETWQYFDFQDKIGRDTKKHSEVIYDSRVDSLIKVLNGKNFAQGMLEAGAMEFKDLPKKEAREYMTKVFKVADEAIANDSVWRNVQRPFIDYLEDNRGPLEHLIEYQYLTPIKSRRDGLIYFNWIDGVYPVNERKGLVSWTDRNGDSKPLQSISNIKDND